MTQRLQAVITLVTTRIDLWGREIIAFFLGVGISGLIGLVVINQRYDSSDAEIILHDPVEVFSEMLEPTPTDLPEPTQLQSKDEASSLINLNTSKQTELESLPGIGPALAKRIIDGRPYHAVSEVQKVSGIGIKRYSDIKDLLSI